VDTLNGAQGTIIPTEFKHFLVDKCKVGYGLDGSKHNFPKSLSFGEINLELDDQGEDMYEFFPVQSHVAKRNPMLENSTSMTNHSPNSTKQIPS
jgi:hypothetical protein